MPAPNQDCLLVDVSNPELRILWLRSFFTTLLAAQSASSYLKLAPLPTRHHVTENTHIWLSCDSHFLDIWGRSLTRVRLCFLCRTFCRRSKSTPIDVIRDQPSLPLLLRAGEVGAAALALIPAISTHVSPVLLPALLVRLCSPLSPASARAPAFLFLDSAAITALHGVN